MFRKRNFVQLLRRLRRPAIFGSLRRTSPLSSCWGYDRGTPIGRYYVEQFLEQHRSEITGTVLEVGDSEYTRQFGSNVKRVEILDVNPENPRATIYADLGRPGLIPASSFDCVLLTQVMQSVWELRAAASNVFRILRPGGVLLATVGCICMIDPDASDYWHLTPSAWTKLMGDVFGEEAVEVKSYGNVLAAVGSLMGLSAEELSADELDYCDCNYAVIVAVRAARRDAVAGIEKSNIRR